MSDLPQSVTSMSDGTPPKLTIFISYFHEDAGIAGALNNVIQDAFGSDVAVFIDKVSIQQGENIHTSVDANLGKADILAVVSTGVGGPRYWAGYEIGFFQASHRGPAPPDHPLWGNIVVFCSEGSSPGPLAEHKHITLGFDSNELEKTQEQFDLELTIADDESLLLWFGQLFTAVRGEKLEERRKLQDTFKSIISGFWEKVFAEFKQRPKFEFKPQKQIKIRFNSAPEHHFTLGDDAEITLLGNANSVFGILSQSTSRTLSWKGFCTELAEAEGSLAAFWTGTLNRILGRAATKADSLDEVSGNLIWSQNERKLFRLILTTYTTYYNGTVQASLYLVEVLRRKDRGDEMTTLLAKGLQSGLRFRSLFLEEKGLFNYLNIAFPREGLAAVARDIVAELDFFNMDLVEADLHKPADWSEILTADEIEKMVCTWEPLKMKLMEDCKAAIVAKDNGSIESAKSGLAETLKEIASRVGPVNERFLRAIAQKLVAVADDAEAKRAGQESN